MKIISTAFTLSAVATALCTVANADKAFHHNDTAHGNSTSKIKTAANFGNGGAKIELCPSGDCATGQLITLSMSRLEELDDKNKTAQKAANFASLSASWTDFETLDIAGIEAMSTSFVADVPVGKADTAKFNLTATIYTANGTAMNGNQTIDVPAGALKFSVSISSWPFMAVTNRLTFGIKLKARGKGNKDQGAPSKKAKGGNHTDIDRVSLGEGMFMDAPTLAVVDGVDTAIDSSLETTGSVTEFVWVFPHFTTSVYYDPVSGSEDASATSTTSSDASAAGTETSTPTGTPASTTDTPTPSPSPSSGSSAKVWASYVIAVAAAASAYFIVV